MRALEVLLWSCGAALVLLYLVILGWTELERSSGVRHFALARQAAQMHAPDPGPAPLVGDGGQVRSDALPPPSPPPPAPKPKPVQHAPSDAAVAVLRIPSIRLELPVAPGTAERVLTRGAGWIDGTAAPGSEGNVGIAAHRDSHFRGLKDVAVGDLIELDTLHGTRSYRVTDLSVVEPTDVHVLAETGEAVLTLVTCFPFYFVGHAPQRFIVRAVATGPEPPPWRTP
jgi:sortase A